ncbi:MAG: hypothetical protein RLO50_07365 [Azospirillaceae bacterium]
MTWKPRSTGALAGDLAAVIAITLYAPTAFAACQVYDEPDHCDMQWTLENDFWIGQYTVEMGRGFVSVDGQAMPMQPTPLAMATIFQIGPDLVIDHPERRLQADLTSVSLDTPAWDWDDRLAEDMPAMSLSDVEIVLDCSNAELPRWSAPTHSDDGHPMTLDLVAVGPYNIYGLLHAEGMMDGHYVIWQSQVNFSRETFPVESLDLVTIESDAACDQICSNSPFLCP